MSSVIFQNMETHGFVATDTLAVNEHGNPGLFRSKAFYIPHLKTITYATGWGDVLEDWFIHINRRMVVAGIEHLDCFATETLQSIWEEFNERNKAHLQKHLCKTVTVYHMGVSEVTGKIVVYAYRSKEGFASEKLKPGIGVKPECTVPDGPADLMEMMKEQRHIQQNSGIPFNQQVHIGGEIQVYQLDAEAGECRISTHARFDDYEQMFKQMCGKIRMDHYLEEWEQSLGDKPY
ncbi:hypothetical protein [Halomonas sp. MS1]|nr:hypothetical protein [Halomonas sp. MS1]UTD55479.1 hypothetical protein NF683_20435 [Halomonas sp. MS1]